jgi:hypothetical protein
MTRYLPLFDATQESLVGYYHKLEIWALVCAAGFHDAIDPSDRRAQRPLLRRTLRPPAPAGNRAATHRNLMKPTSYTLSLLSCTRL